MLRNTHQPGRNGISEMNGNSTRNLVVEGGGTQVVGHVGLHALGSFADRLGMGEALSDAVGWRGPGVPGHDRGKVLTQIMLMLAGGGECCADIEFLGSQERLFAAVCSDSTVYQTFTETLDAPAVARAREAVARIRSQVWTRSASTTGTGPMILDLDASLVEIHSENKEGTAPHFKGGFGFHPVFCFADATGETLAAMLRPGNATANDAADLLGVLDAGIAQLPADVMAGHCVDDDPGEVRRRVVVRSDSAGCSAAFVDGCRSPQHRLRGGGPPKNRCFSGRGGGQHRQRPVGEGPPLPRLKRWYATPAGRWLNGPGREGSGVWSTTLTPQSSGCNE